MDFLWDGMQEAFRLVVSGDAQVFHAVWVSPTGVATFVGTQGVLLQGSVVSGISIFYINFLIGQN